MTLTIYNTLTRNKEEFIPLNPPKVGMYVCGVTVYDECHLGHARALVNFDVVYRYLKFSGFNVTFVRNYTDVDDKIISRGLEQNVPWDEIAKRYIATFDRDMISLGNSPPQIQPKATENIDAIIELIQKLIDKDFAYKAGGDVFYSVRKKEDYGKLSGKKIDELESGARIEIHELKKDPLDFALWKGSKPGEPAWDSPWGPGRPGWHIECSAMSMRFLGETFDIHGGGRDLSFPHHENEIAQSEAATGKLFARYWIHNGFVNINAQKMSKSLNNFLTIRELLESYHPEVLRLFILSAHYRSPLDYTDGAMQATRSSLTRWYTTLSRVQGICENSQTGDPKVEKELSEKISILGVNFKEAMDDDFNTARVTGLLFDMAREWNKVLDAKKMVSGHLCKNFLEEIKKIHAVLGLFGANPDVFLESEKKMFLKDAGLTSEGIEKLILDRKQARLDKNWPLADEIRKKIDGLGLELKDNPDGTTQWNVK